MSQHLIKSSSIQLLTKCHLPNVLSPKRKQGGRRKCRLRGDSQQGGRLHTVDREGACNFVLSV